MITETNFIIIFCDSVSQKFRQGRARMACLFSRMSGLSAEITPIARGWNSLITARNHPFYSRLLTWASYQHVRQPQVCQSFYIVDQGSERECSKRQETEDASLLRPGSRSTNSHIRAIYYQSKQSQSLPRFKRKDINPTSRGQKYQRIGSHLYHSTVSPDPKTVPGKKQERKMSE